MYEFRLSCHKTSYVNNNTKRVKYQCKILCKKTLVILTCIKIIEFIYIAAMLH